MELKPGYKQTEVGVIPEDWDIRSLQDLCKEEIAYGIVQCGPHVPGGIPYIRVSDMDGPILDRDKMLCTSSKIASRFRRSEVRHGDIVYALRGRLGDVRAIPLDLDGANLTQGTARISPGLSVHSQFLLWALRNPEVVLRACAESKGTTFMEITLSDLRQIKIALPPKLEQLRIVSTLFDIEDHLTALNLELGKKRNIKQAAMQELLTGKRRLPGFEGEWVVKRLGDVAHIKTGSKNNEDKVEDGDYPFFVRSDNVERIGSYSYDCEAVLVPGEGRIGDIFHYIQGRFDVHQRVYAITQFAHEVSGKFVHSYMAMNFGAWAMQNTVKATVDSLRLPTFQTFEMLMPPSKEEQDAIAVVLTEIEAELAALEARKDKAQELKQGIMQQLLTGKIRLT
jgi:type I restriction enzyme S subunit